MDKPVDKWVKLWINHVYIRVVYRFVLKIVDNSVKMSGFGVFWWQNGGKSTFFEVF